MDIKNLKNTSDKYIYEYDNNNIFGGIVNKIERDAMGDDDIRYYTGDGLRIMTLNDISKYNNIVDILPKTKDYIYILYESKPNFGHWVLLTRHNNIISYFDPYGYKIDYPIKWASPQMREELNIKPYLTNLLNKSDFDIEYNGFIFQNRNNLDIATCGRHCTFRLLTFLNYDMLLDNYIDMMKYIKKKTGATYDKIVSDLINKI
jgi:hypothetical protein